MKNFLKITLKVVGVLVVLASLTIVAILIVMSFKKPEQNRNWAEDSRILPDITISSSTVSVKNVRDWKYEKDVVTSRGYYNETYDLSKLDKTYLLFNPFGEWEGIGHSFFVFTFKDGKSVSVSIEARREEGEAYDVLAGTFNEYEMWYAFGSEQDFVNRRLKYNSEDLYKYPLLISASSSRALFVDIATQAEKLETTPEFYNTVTSNCTNLLADSANRVKKGSVPFHYSRLFTGYADNQLYNLKLIPHDKPFEEIYREAQIANFPKSK